MENPLWRPLTGKPKEEEEEDYTDCIVQKGVGYINQYAIFNIYFNKAEPTHILKAHIYSIREHYYLQ